MNISFNRKNGFLTLLAVTALTLQCASSKAETLHEDFESYRVGEFPWKWIAHANAASDPKNNRVAQDPAGKQKQVLQVYGSEPLNWSALVFNRAEFADSFEVKFKVYVEKEFQKSQGSFTFQLRSEPHFEAPARALISFDKKGEVEVGERPQLVRPPYEYGRWYSVKLSYQRKDDKVFVNAWVDGQLVGSSIEAARDVEDQMKYLGFGGRGRFYIDDVELQ
jgi:hypothetical protein